MRSSEASTQTRERVRKVITEGAERLACAEGHVGSGGTRIQDVLAGRSWAVSPRHFQPRPDARLGVGRWWAAPLFGLIALIMTSSSLDAQSASHTMIVSATVAPEESYFARDAVDEALRAGGTFRSAGKRYRGVAITERVAPAAAPRTDPVRVITVVFTAT